MSGDVAVAAVVCDVVVVAGGVELPHARQIASDPTIEVRCMRPSTTTSETRLRRSGDS